MTLTRWDKTWLREMLKTREDIREALVILLCECDKQELAGRMLAIFNEEIDAYTIQVTFSLEEIAAAATSGVMERIIKRRIELMGQRAIADLKEKGFADGK